MAERYTQTEAGRIVGVSSRQLDYWARLQLVRPQARWGERFYNFADLVALGTIKRVVERSIPARRLRRVLAEVEREFGEAPVNLAALCVRTSGRQVAVIPPGCSGPLLEPLSGQYLLSFESGQPARKVHSMLSRSAEEWFELALSYDSQRETLPEAAAAYRRAIELSPGWIEAHINLGVALYLLGETENARGAFAAAVEIDDSNSLAHFNLGCALDELGRLDEAIEHLEIALRLAPNLADAHFNLALALEKRREKPLARTHWSQYLQHAPNGLWADYARSRISPPRPRGSAPEPIPFPLRGNQFPTT